MLGAAGVAPAIAASQYRIDCWPHVARLSTVTGEAGTCPTRIKQAALIALRSEVEPAGFAPAMPITVPCSPPLPRREAGAHALKGMLKRKRTCGRAYSPRGDAPREGVVGNVGFEPTFAGYSHLPLYL